MNKLTRSFCDRALAVLLASLMLYAGSAVPVTAQSIATTQQTQLRYDGETLFRGLLLDEGPVAKLFPEIWENPIVVGYRDKAMQRGSEEQAAAGRRTLIAALRTQDPTFFDRFGKEMQSGDHIRIQQAMNEAGERLILMKRFQVGTGDPADDHVYIESIAAAVRFEVVFLFIPPSCDPGTGCTNSHALQRDVMVDLVANRLGSEATAQ